MQKEDAEKLLSLSSQALRLFEAQEHIMYDRTEKRWYCTGQCEVNQCPALLLRDFLLFLE